MFVYKNVDIKQGDKDEFDYWMIQKISFVNILEERNIVIDYRMIGRNFYKIYIIINFFCKINIYFVYNFY